MSNFINKNSESLLKDLKSFINYYLGFGHFVYRDTQGRQIAIAKSMKEFEQYLETIPEDSLVYHAMKNHFSLWFIARGEVEIAKRIESGKEEILSAALNCPVVVREVIKLGRDLRAGRIELKELTNEADDEETTFEEEKLHKKRIFSLIDRIPQTPHLFPPPLRFRSGRS
jgi:hypothetical protein